MRDEAGAAALDDIHDDISWILALLGGDIRKNPPLHVLEVLVPPHVDDPEALGSPHSQVLVLPLGGRRLELPFDAVTDRGIRKPLFDFLAGSRAGPGRQKGSKTCRAPNIGIEVGRDIQALPTGGGDALDHLRHLAPVRKIGSLQVGDVNSNVRFASDAKDFVERFEEGVTLTALMGLVCPTVSSGNTCHGDELFGTVEATRHVHQRRVHPEGTVFHRLGC